MATNPSNFNLNSIKEASGVFKFGSGVLGKSAIVIGVLMAAAGIAIYKLQSDLAIFGALIVAAIIFFLWFFPVIRFAEKHPDTALLEGAEWSGFQRFQAAAKGYIPNQGDRQPVIAPGTHLPELTEAQKSQPEEEH